MDVQTRPLPFDVHHPAYEGHFPAAPVLPGAVLLDGAIAQMLTHYALALTQCEIVSAKFLRAVRPGDALTIEHRRGADGSVRFTVLCGTDAVLKGTLREV